jgi:hypothetical protein
VAPNRTEYLAFVDTAMNKRRGFLISKLCRGCSYPTFRTNVLETSNHTRIRDCRLPPKYKSDLRCSGM